MRISDWSSDVCSSDLFQAAAAEIAHQTVGVGNARDDAERRQPGLFVTAQEADREAGARFDLRQELRTVGSFAGGGGSERLDPLCTHPAGYRSEPRKVRQSL